MGRLWYIRHGQTNFNIKNNEWHRLGDPIDQSGFHYTEEYIDPPLNETGVQQVLSNKNSILQFPIDLVYVSPLLRALQTCSHIFTAPNPPRIVVNPFLTEWIHVNHDVPLYPNDYPQKFPQFDWSYMPEGFYIPSILSNSYTASIGPHSPSIQLLNIMKTILPELVETNFELYQRAQRVKALLQQETSTQNIAIVGHSAFYRHFTGECIENKITADKYLHNGQYTEYFF
jgi:broad specificity phosphatase PhoE